MQKLLTLTKKMQKYIKNLLMPPLAAAKLMFCPWGQDMDYINCKTEAQMNKPKSFIKLFPNYLGILRNSL